MRLGAGAGSEATQNAGRGWVLRVGEGVPAWGRGGLQGAGWHGAGDAGP